jgi:hypothetical protein
LAYAKLTPALQTALTTVPEAHLDLLTAAQSDYAALQSVI